MIWESAEDSDSNEAMVRRAGTGSLHDLGIRCESVSVFARASAPIVPPVQGQAVYSSTVILTDPEQLFVVSDSPVTASTQAP